MVIHQLMEAYGWSYEEAMSRTVPQIILLTHASWCSSERIKRKIDADNTSKGKKKKKEDTNPIVFNGKRIDELTSDEQVLYYGDWGN